jgi:hypothetical protein
VSGTDSARESLRAAGFVGDATVEQIHRDADGFSFIRPERALKDADID